MKYVGDYRVCEGREENMYLLPSTLPGSPAGALQMRLTEDGLTRENQQKFINVCAEAVIRGQCPEMRNSVGCLDQGSASLPW